MEDGRRTTDDGRQTATIWPSSVICRPWSLTLLWLGAALRLRGLFANTFHADEALFATWARLIAVWRDPLLLTQPVDKPPLLFYSQALFYPLFGPVEWAARWPSLIASLLLIPLTAQLALRLTGDRLAALLAAAVVALAPLSIQFSATAFSDPLLTMWLVAALALAARHNRQASLPASGFWAGFCFGLALATKYQALLFLPLLVGVGWLSSWRGWEWRRGGAGVAVVVTPLLLWAAARSDGSDLIAQQWANIGGVRPAWSWELWPRLASQAHLWQLGVGWPLFLSGTALAVAALSRRVRAGLSAADGLLALFIAGYFLLHWLWAVPAWDRYWLPVIPLAAVLLARLLLAVVRAVPAGRAVWVAVAALLVIVMAQLPVALAARSARYPIGGQPAADGGAAEVALLLADAPYGTVLYDHWYSWQWGYHLFDRRVYVSWFPHAGALLEDLAVFGDGREMRIIALPVGDIARPVTLRLEEAGYRLEPLPGPPGAAMGLWRILKEKE